ncbi:MAG: amidohydrolase [Nitrospinae bacterium]|nr:amidohydrolase [Nitrospinota bacterium]
MAKRGFKMIDAEMHVMEPVDLWERYIDPEFTARAPRRLNERRWDIRTVVEGEVMASMPGGDWPALSDAEEKALFERYAEEIARQFDPPSQVKAMDKEGLDLAVLYPTSGMYVIAFDTMDPAFAAAACRAYNNWLYEYIQAADPSRLFGAAVVSPHDVTTAVAEARRSVQELRMKAIFLRPNVFNNRPWHDSFYDPLWAACQDLGVAVGFHETTGSRMKAAGADRFHTLGIAHISTHSVEQMLACMDVIMGGVMERFPKLRFAFLEGQCGWLPFWLDRMDDHYEWRKPYGEMEHLQVPPSEYFRRQGFCAVECDEEFVTHVVDVIGDDNLVTTTDYPHGDSKYPHAMDRFLSLPLKERSKQKILWDNAARLYKL